MSSLGGTCAARDAAISIAVILNGAKRSEESRFVFLNFENFCNKLGRCIDYYIDGLDDRARGLKGDSLTSD